MKSKQYMSELRTRGRAVRSPVTLGQRRKNIERRQKV